MSDNVSCNDTNTDVHVGNDGWLFLIGGSNHVLSQYESGGLPDGHLDYWRRLYEDRQRRCGGQNISYFNIIVPEKISVYDHKLKDIKIDLAFAPSRQIEQILSSSSARECNIDLLSIFRKLRDEADLYLRTDSHWSFKGCYLAYEAFCRRAGVLPQSLLTSDSRPTIDNFVGDLGVKLSPPFEERVERLNYLRESKLVHANSLVRHFEKAGMIHASGTGSHAIYHTNVKNADPRTLVIFGDSYTSHVYTPIVGRLIGFLAETFRETHVIWANTIDYGYLKRVNADIVLTQIAERFMIELPMVEFDIGDYERDQFSRKVGYVA